MDPRKELVGSRKLSLRPEVTRQLLSGSHCEDIAHLDRDSLTRFRAREFDEWPKTEMNDFNDWMAGR